MKYLGPPQSGSLANQTASRNPFGQYLRARVGRGGVPDLSIGGAVAAWQALSASRQKAWGEYSRSIVRLGSLGHASRLSGYQFFVRAWMFATWASASPDLDPPWNRDAIGIESVTLSAVGLTVTASVSVVGSGGGIVETQWAVPVASTGTTAPPGRGAYWAVGNRSNVSAPTTATHAHTFPSSGRAFARSRVIGFDWVPRAWVYAPFLAI
jgi:hypothetical protein